MYVLTVRVFFIDTVFLLSILSRSLEKTPSPETVLSILVKSLMNQEKSVMMCKCMAWTYLAGPGPSQCNYCEYTLKNLSFELGTFQGKEHAIRCMGSTYIWQMPEERE